MVRLKLTELRRLIRAVISEAWDRSDFDAVFKKLDAYVPLNQYDIACFAEMTIDCVADDNEEFYVAPEFIDAGWEMLTYLTAGPGGSTSNAQMMVKNLRKQCEKYGNQRKEVNDIADWNVKESLDFEIDEFLLYRVEEFAERIVKKYSPEALKRYEDIRKDKSDMKSRVAQQMKSQATNANHDALLQQTAPARVNRPPRSGK